MVLGAIPSNMVFSTTTTHYLKNSYREQSQIKTLNKETKAFE